MGQPRPANTSSTTHDKHSKSRPPFRFPTKTLFCLRMERLYYWFTWYGRENGRACRTRTAEWEDSASTSPTRASRVLSFYGPNCLGDSRSASFSSSTKWPKGLWRSAERQLAESQQDQMEAKWYCPLPKKQPYDPFLIHSKDNSLLWHGVMAWSV